MPMKCDACDVLWEGEEPCFLCGASGRSLTFRGPEVSAMESDEGHTGNT